MPELPEVETVVEYLKQIKNKSIVKYGFVVKKCLINSSIPKFNKFITNVKIINVIRKGKNIVLCLSNKKFLVFHLRMEGKLTISNEIENKYLMCYFLLSDNKYLLFSDFRKFGTIHIYEDKLNLNIGIDPFDKDFVCTNLLEKFKSNKPIKTLIMDQKIICGIGNIYSDEILFLLKMYPLKKANTLTKKQIQDFIVITKKILTKAIKCGGTTVFSFSSGNHKGMFQKFLNVYGIKKCKICGTQIKKIKINGRSCSYCPHCQNIK